MPSTKCTLTVQIDSCITILSDPYNLSKIQLYTEFTGKQNRPLASYICHLAPTADQFINSTLVIGIETANKVPD